MPIVHLVARLRSPYRHLRSFEPAQWLWQRIEAHYPGLIAAVIMPNHPHVLADVDDAHAARHQFASTCGHLGRTLGIPRLFEPLPPPEIVEPNKVPRVARYIELNPNRAGLVLHPLEWMWTTLRDVAGATVWPSIDPGLHRRRTKRRDTWLDYVTTDDRVSDRRALREPVQGHQRIPAFGMQTIAAAVLAATRSSPDALRRRGPTRALFIAAALDQGMGPASLIASFCGCSTRAVQLARHEPIVESQLLPIRRCLADDRLRLPTTDLVRVVQSA